MKKLLTGLSVLLLCGAAAGAFGAWLDWLRFQQAPLALDGPRVVTIAPGTGLGALVADWQRRGWLDRPRDALWLRMLARRDGSAGRIQTGEFRLQTGWTAPQALDWLVNGQAVQYELTIIEGWTYRQLRAALAQAPALRQTLDPDAEVMGALGQGGLAPEGRFFPDTYRYPRGYSDLDMLRRANREMTRLLEEVWETRDPDLPLKSPDELLTLASIIEKETSLREEMPQIAGVFARRLRRGMRLQTDPTVIYGLGDSFDGNLRRADLRRDTAFNTYTRHGLPPTPICLPGRDALAAAAHPAAGDTLYFVSRGDGSHEFSATIEAHNAAVRRYQLKGRP